MKKKSKVQSNDRFSNPPKRKFQPQYMNPQSLRSYKKKSCQDLFRQTQGIEEKDFYKKYYGKKVLYISDSREIIQVIHSSKLFRTIALSSKLFSSACFKALGNMIIVGNDFSLRGNHHQKIIQRSKGKLIYTLESSLRGLHGLRGFKTLELFLAKREQLSEFSPGILKELSRLEKVRIQFHIVYRLRPRTIFLEEEGESMKQTFKFLLEMIENSTALKIFQCDLSPFYMESKFLRKLLLYLDNYKVESWYIKARISFEDFFEITQTNSRLKRPHFKEAHNFQEVLDTVDLLGLHNSENIDRDLVEICEREDQSEHSPQLLSEIPSMLCRHNRILDINESYVGIRKPKNRINLGLLLRNFGSLRGLYVQITQGDLMLENEKRIGSLENLRNVILSEVDYSLFEKKEEKGPTLESLLKILSKSSPKLKRMQIYSDSFKIMGDRDFGFLIKRGMKIHEEYLKDFERLRELEINTDDGFPNGFERIVKRLRVLRVNFCEFRNNKKKYDLQIAPFVGNHLKELHFIIRSKQQEINWIDKLAWNVDRFPDLEVLVVDDQSDHQIQLERFCRFTKAVIYLKNLRRLVVKMKLEESRSDYYSNLLSQDVMNTIRRLEDEMIESIQKNTRTLIKSHPDLEEIDIQGFCEHKIDRIFYQRTTLKGEKVAEKNLFRVGEKFK